MPPRHTIWRGASSVATVTGNARPGLMVTWRVTRSPGAIRPSTFVTVGFQRGYCAASVRIDQILSGVARMTVLAAKFFIRLESVRRRVLPVNAPRDDELLGSSLALTPP